MGIFTEFRRGKTIENQELEPYNPSAATWGNMPPAPPGDISSETRSFTTRPVTSEFQQRERGCSGETNEYTLPEHCEAIIAHVSANC